MIISVRSAVLCDEVRREDNGKAIFIGVYGQNVISWSRPNLLEFRIVLSFAVDSAENEAELRMSAGSEVTQRVTIRGTDGWASLIVPLHLVLTEPLRLRVAIRNVDQDWFDVMEWKLDFGEGVEESTSELADELKSLAARMKAGEA